MPASEVLDQAAPRRDQLQAANNASGSAGSSGWGGAAGAPLHHELTDAPNRRSGFEAQKSSHAIQLCLKFALERAIARWVRFDIAELRLKLTVLY